MWAKDVQPYDNCYYTSGECCASSHIFCAANHWMLIGVKHINGSF